MQNIIYILLNYLNRSITKDTSYQIALCLLENLRKIPELSLQDTADLCHVSVATLNRFCKMIGLDNYSTLRKISTYHTLLEYPTHYDQEFIHRLTENLTVIENIHLTSIDEVVNRIYMAKEIYLLGYGDFQFEALYFQKHLFSHGKYVRLLSDVMPDASILKKLNKNDLIILTSIQLEYMFLNKNTSKQQMLSDLTCQKILITQSNNQSILKLFDVVLQCGPHTDHDVRTYTILHIYDRLIARYHEKYCPIVYE